jgi:hypothetical protein
MAKLFSLHFSNKKTKDTFNIQIKKVFSWIELEFGQDHRIKVIDDPYSWTIVIGYTERLNLESNYGYLGFVNSSTWKEFGDFPDGNYFIYRRQKEKIEIVSDYVASRTVWYYSNKDFFCFSTIQIPIIVLLNSFQFNQQVVPWFISSGTLGLGNSWDSRISQLPRNSYLEFDFFKFKSNLITIPSTIPSPKNFRFKDFKALLSKSLSNMRLDPKKSIHLLSGGVESRLLVSYLAKPLSIPTVTWGTKVSEKDRNSEINIARRISKISNLPHRTIYIQNNSESVDSILEEYLKYGEGRVDHILGYVDGFGIWKEFQDSGIDFVIRGDQGFGRKTLKNDVLARKVIGCEFIKDYNNLDSVFINNPIQKFESLLRSKSESLVGYSKRIGIEFRHPIVNAALSDLKLAFVEIANPLLNRCLLEYSEIIPEKLALNKKISINVNDINFKGIPYSKNRDGVKVDDLLTINLKNYVYKEIMSLQDTDFESLGLSSKSIRNICKNMISMQSNKTFFQKVKSIIPKKIKQVFYSNSFNSLPNIRLLLRILIILKMKNKIRLALS